MGAKTYEYVTTNISFKMKVWKEISKIGWQGFFVKQEIRNVAYFPILRLVLTQLFWLLIFQVLSS